MQLVSRRYDTGIKWNVTSLHWRQHWCVELNICSLVAWQAEEQFHARPTDLLQRANPTIHMHNGSFSIAPQVAIMKTVLGLFFNTLITVDFSVAETRHSRVAFVMLVASGILFITEKVQNNLLILLNLMVQKLGGKGRKEKDISLWWLINPI